MSRGDQMAVQVPGAIDQKECASPVRIPTGIAGLDEILFGGLIPCRSYLVRGGPGTGKTTFGLQFLAARDGDEGKRLLITLGERADRITADARTLGLDLSQVEILDLSPSSSFFAQTLTYDIFSPAEVEREPTTKSILEAVERLKPRRVFIDAMTQFRYLAADAFQFRREALSFMRYLIEHDATVVLTSEGTVQEPDDDLQFMCDGVINLASTPHGRTISIVKYRGSDFRAGAHTMRLTDHGMEVYPRLIPESHRRQFPIETIASGVPELDDLLHGGIERGTITIITGPSGVGKTSVGLQFMKEAAGRGERSVVYTFEEEEDLILRRCEGINIPARRMIERGTLSIVKIEPLQYTADEFANIVRHEVEDCQARIVMLDSVAGYRVALRGEDLVGRLHGLCKYLQNMGVAALVVNEVEPVAGEFRATEHGISYLADNILFLRFFEARRPGLPLEIRKVIGVLKKRLTDFERTPRELEITRYGIRVGPPLAGLSTIIGSLPAIGCGAEGGR